MKSMKPNKTKITASVFILLTAIFLGGCSAHMANYGRNQFSNEAREKFESFQVLPDANYFFIGSNVSPDAIIAVDKNYTVTSSGIWSKVEPGSKELKYMIQTLQRRVFDSPKGYNLLDPKGNQIGLYYSRWDPWPVRMEGENKVWVYPPDKKESVGFERGK